MLGNILERQMIENEILADLEQESNDKVKVEKETTSNITYALINKVKKETEKAYLVEGFFSTWLPKSLVTIINVPEINMTLVKMPTWLWVKNNNSLTYKITPDELYKRFNVIIQ